MVNSTRRVVVSFKFVVLNLFYGHRPGGRQLADCLQHRPSDNRRGGSQKATQTSLSSYVIPYVIVVLCRCTTCETFEIRHWPIAGKVLILPLTFARYNLCVSRNLKVATVRTHKLHDIWWQQQTTNS